MSAIYGCLLKNQMGLEKCFAGLSYWNSEYGNRCFSVKIDELSMETNLEHFSKDVPEQTEVLCSGNYSAVMDALIFNRKELITAYELADSLSDEELLFELILSKGIDIIKEVNGEFAGALYDQENGIMTIFRDHMGLRPVYYYIDDENFIFSTDIRGILAYDSLSFTIDEKKIYAEAMGTFNDYAENTDYEEIHYLRKASYARFSLRGERYSEIDKTIYWKPGKKKIRFSSETEYITELRRLVEDAIKIRMDACDGPIGAELSGGLDSSVIASFVGRLGHEGRYFSWSRDPAIKPIVSERDERILIQEICDRDQISCKYRGSKNPEEQLTIQEIQNHYFPAFVNTPQIRTASAWFASEGVHMVLSGHGGDEGVSHRPGIYELWYHGEYAEYFEILYGYTKGRKLRLLRTVKQFYYQMKNNNPRKIDASNCSADNIGMCLKEEFLTRMKKVFKAPPFTFFYDPIKYLEIGAVRFRTDNTALLTPHYGIRYSFPYMDYRLIDYAVSIPRYLYIKNGITRWIYRETFKDLLPQSIDKLYSKKTLSNKKDDGVTEEMKKAIEEDMKVTTDELDRTYWNRYLDFNQIDHFVLSDHPSKDDYNKYCFQMARFTFMILAHSIMKRAAEPVNKMMENCYDEV